MDYLPLLILPLLATICLLAFLFIKASEERKPFKIVAESLRKEKRTESFFFISFITIVFGMITLAPWISFYVYSGAKLNLINYFIIQLFILSLLVIVATGYLKRRDFK